MEGGALHRYLIGREGVVELLEVGPRSPRDDWGRPLCLVGFFASLGGFAALIGGEIIEPMPWWHPEAAGTACAVGIAAGALAFLTAPRLAAPPGEWWKYFPPPRGD